MCDVTLEHETITDAGRYGERAPRARFALPRTSPWAWALVPTAAVVLMSTSFDRFFLWDEAVFWSQVHDYRGSGAGPAVLDASRELGSVLVLHILGLVSDDLASNRLLWSLLTLAVVFVVFRRIGRFLGPLAGPAGAFLFGTFWVSELFVDSFYANQFGALFQLGAVSAYLAIRIEDGDRVARGIAFGAFLAAAFWMRQIETALVVAVLLVHSLVHRPSLVWRTRIRSLCAATATFLLAFVVPWVIDTINRYGSVPSRIREARSQGFGRGLVNNAGTYGSTMLGRSVHLRSEAPLWAGVATLVVMFGVAVWLLAISRSRGVRKLPRGQNEAVALLVVLSVVLYGFFFFWIEITRDRYLMSGTVFAAAAAGGAIGIGIERLRVLEDRSRARFGVALTALALVWVVSQTTIARHHEHVWDVSTWDQEQTASLIRTLAAKGPCSGVARFGQPVIELGSGCATIAAPNAEAALEELQRLERRTRLEFVVWPTKQVGDLGLDGSWQHIVQRTSHSSLTISYRLADDG